MIKKAKLTASLVIVFLFATGCCKHAPKDSAH
jgi:PBP1b-binding outer membrane lipoprotein LpoB